MPSDIRKDLEKRAQEAILKNIIENYKQQGQDWLQDPAIKKTIWERAIYSLASAVSLGGNIVVSGLLGLFFSWLLALPVFLVWLAAQAVLIYLAANNEKSHARVVAEMLRPKLDFNPETIQNSAIRAKVNEALKYWELIDSTVSKSSEASIRNRFERTTQEVTHWLQAVYDLAKRIDRFELNAVIRQDLERVPKEIRTLEGKLALEDSPEVSQQLERTIADKKRQLQTLRNLDDNMEKANYQLDSTISSLGTIYSQLLLVGSKDEEGNRVNRLQNEISEQVQRLEDLAEVMDEVYQRSS
jgi:rubrerythrin